MHCFISKVLRLDSFWIIWFIFRRAWSNIGWKRSAPARDHKEGCTGRGKRTTNSTSWNTHARMKSAQNQRSVGFSLSDKIEEQLLNLFLILFKFWSDIRKFMLFSGCVEVQTGRAFACPRAPHRLCDGVLHLREMWREVCDVTLTQQPQLLQTQR